MIKHTTHRTSILCKIFASSPSLRKNPYAKKHNINQMIRTQFRGFGLNCQVIYFTKYVLKTSPSSPKNEYNYDVNVAKKLPDELKELAAEFVPRFGRSILCRISID
jgi:hypothetical protein